MQSGGIHRQGTEEDVVGFGDGPAHRMNENTADGQCFEIKAWHLGSSWVGLMVSGDHSGSMPASLMRLPQFASWARTNSPSCSGLLAIVSAANVVMRSLISGLASAFRTSALNLSTISLGVPAGANMATQAVTSKPASPGVSEIAGSSGIRAERLTLETPIARSLPALTRDCPAAMSVIPYEPCPPIPSVIACGELLYGMGVTVIPAALAKLAPTTCPMLLP